MNRTLTNKEELDDNLAEIGLLDAKIAEIEESYNAQMRQATEVLAKVRDEKLQPMLARLNVLWDESEDYVKSNRKELMPESKTLSLDNGTVFYRDTPGAVALRSRKKNAAQVALAWLEKRFPRFVRTKPEIDKEAILAEYHQNPSIMDKLTEYFRIATSEKFYVRPVSLTHILVRTESGAIKREAIGGDTKKKRKAA